MSAGKVDVSGKELFKSLDNVVRGPNETHKFLVQRSFPTRNFIDSYLNFDAGGQLNFVNGLPVDGFCGESQEFAFTFQKVASDTFSRRDISRRPRIESPLHFRGNCGHYSESTVPIHSGEIMKNLESGSQSSIRVVERFFSTIRLYRRKPVFQVLREFMFVDSRLIEISFFGTDRKVQAIYVGGRLGSLSDGDCLPDGPIQARAELIKKLTDFEREVVIRRDIDKEGSDPCPIIFLLYIDSLSFLWKRGSPFSCQRFAMHFGPLDTLPAILE